MLEIFETIFNTYKTIESIGNGGSGVVFKVKDNENNLLALKCINQNMICSTKIKRFKNELYFCFKNKHDNILKVIDWGFILQNNQKIPFYVMPLYDKTLRQIINEKVDCEKKLKIFSQILNGIEAAHLMGVWHRDIKPENILLDKNDEKVVISDFGIAHFEEEYLTTIETKAGERLANFLYAAPEQRQKGKSVDIKADIFALGIILNELFTNEIPAGTKFTKISDLYPNYAYLDEIVETMISQAPEARPNSINHIKLSLKVKYNNFIELQQISKLKSTVIKNDEIDDPLVIDPIKLIDLDYENNQLVFILNQTVNSDWIDSFHALTNYSCLIGKEPSAHNFKSNRAFISAEEKNAQQITDNFKKFLSLANKSYMEKKIKENNDNTKRQMELIKKEIEEKEKKNRLLEKIII